MKSTDTRKGFTLVEVLVVLAILAMLMAAVTTSLAGAKRRARIAKAESEVKVITQAILSYENWDEAHSLPTMENRDADSGAVGFLIGHAGSARSGEIPTLLMAQLNDGGKMMDPWDTPYKITIREGSVSFKAETASGTLQTGYFYPNYYRLSEEERE